MSEPVKPPAAPALILNLFASASDSPQVEGDLMKEFHQRAIAFGAAMVLPRSFSQCMDTAQQKPTVQTAAAATISVVVMRWAPIVGHLWSSAVNFPFPVIALLRLIVGLCLGAWASGILPGKQRALTLG
jgi:hypothetical protein